MLTVKEFASRLQCSPQTVYRAIRDGSLKATRLRPESPYLIPESELRRILEGA